MSIPNMDDCFDANFRMRGWLWGGYDRVFFAKEPSFCGALLQKRPEEVSVSVLNEHFVLGYYVRICIYVYMYICTHMYMCIYVYMCNFFEGMYVCHHGVLCTYMYICMYTCTFI